MAAIVAHRATVDRMEHRVTAAITRGAPSYGGSHERLVMAEVDTLRAEEAVTRAAEVVDTRAVVAEVTPAVVTAKSKCNNRRC